MVRLKKASAATAKDTISCMYFKDRPLQLTLVIRYLMTRLVNPREREVSILSDFTVLSPVDCQWYVASSSKLGRIRVVDSEGYGLASEPVACGKCQ